MRALTLLLTAGFFVSACATAPEPAQPGPSTQQPAQAQSFALQAADFTSVPGWAEADLGPALLAFQRACASRAQRDPDARLPGGGRYGGTVRD